MHWVKKLWLRAKQTHPDKLPEIKLLPNPLSQLQQKISELTLEIENDNYTLPEFSSYSREEAKGLSLKALSISRRILSIGVDSDIED